MRFSSKFGSERAVDAVHVRHGRQVALLGHSLSRRLGAFLIPHPLQAESLPRVTLEKGSRLHGVLACIDAARGVHKHPTGTHERRGGV